MAKMTGQSEVEINGKLLAEAEQALKNEQARIKGVTDSLYEMRGKVVIMMDRGHWDDAQTALLQAKVLSIKNAGALIDVKNAEARVASLQDALARGRVQQAKATACIPCQSPPKIETIQPSPTPLSNFKASEATDLSSLANTSPPPDSGAPGVEDPKPEVPVAPLFSTENGA
jgi:hypothetical protein